MSNHDIVESTIAFVKKSLQGYDASHDWDHIERVLNLARIIAKSESNVDMELVELAAILHDILDWKYSGNETAGEEAAASFLLSQNYPPERVEIIKKIIHGVSFKNELGKNNQKMFPELAIVQDADRCDAIGSIGQII